MWPPKKSCQEGIEENSELKGNWTTGEEAMEVKEEDREGVKVRGREGEREGGRVRGREGG